MAESFDILIEVQDDDTALDQLRHRLDALPERQELGQVAHRRAEAVEQLAAVNVLVDDLKARQKNLEERIAGAVGRRHEIERRMQSADNAARDLQAMDQEVHQLEGRQAHFEEEEIALLEEEEPLDAQLVECAAVVAELDATIDRLESEVARADQEITSQIREKQASRDETASRLPEELSQRYEALRARLGGVGAARLVGNRCDGCHLTLPAMEVERIRNLPDGEFATCDQCDRILVH